MRAAFLSDSARAGRVAGAVDALEIARRVRIAIGVFAVVCLKRRVSDSVGWVRYTLGMKERVRFPYKRQAPSIAAGLLALAIMLHLTLFHLEHAGPATQPAHTMSHPDGIPHQSTLVVSHDQRSCPVPDVFPQSGTPPDLTSTVPVAIAPDYCAGSLPSTLLPFRPTGPERQALLQRFTL